MKSEICELDLSTVRWRLPHIFRHSPGLVPTIRRNAFEKATLCEKPHSRAISAVAIWVDDSNSFAISILRCTSHWWGATPTVALKARAKWLTDMLHSAASSDNDRDVEILADINSLARRICHGARRSFPVRNGILISPYLRATCACMASRT